MSQYPPDKPPQSQFPLPVQEGEGYSSNMYAPPPPMGAGQASGYQGQGSTYYNPPGQYMGGSEHGKWQGGGPAGPGMGMAMGQQQGGGGSAYYPAAANVPPTEFLDPTMPRPNDILPLHPAIIQQRQIAASLPPCPKGGYHELRRRYALGVNARTCLSVICFPIVCCCVRTETVCIKCDEKFDIDLPTIN